MGNNYMHVQIETIAIRTLLKEKNTNRQRRTNVRANRRTNQIETTIIDEVYATILSDIERVGIIGAATAFRAFRFIPWSRFHEALAPYSSWTF